MKRRSKPAATKHASSARRQGSRDGWQVVYSEKQIQKRVRELAEQINRDYKGKTLHVVGILENCFVFMADLVRALKMRVVCQFIKSEIRDSPSGNFPLREIMYTPKVEASGKDVLLMDGVLQSGLTLDHLVRYVMGQNPSSVRTATLIEKTAERKVDVSTNYVGFKTTEKFLVGYGLGYQNLYRNLPCIARLVRAH